MYFTPLKGIEKTAEIDKFSGVALHRVKREKI